MAIMIRTNNGRNAHFVFYVSLSAALCKSPHKIRLLFDRHNAARLSGGRALGRIGKSGKPLWATWHQFDTTNLHLSLLRCNNYEQMNPSSSRYKLHHGDRSNRGNAESKAAQLQAAEGGPREQLIWRFHMGDQWSDSRSSCKIKSFIKRFLNWFWV